ncbi:MAG: DUF6273 domain-containing protein [Clostridia bacterium]|nr:DUF6273 domain-containing protein [Clostridia bacterium]
MKKCLSVLLVFTLFINFFFVGFKAEASNDDFDENTYIADLLTRRIQSNVPELQEEMFEMYYNLVNEKKSYARFFVEGCEESESLMLSMKSWEVYTFHINSTLDSCVERRNYYVKLILSLLGSSMMQDSSVKESLEKTNVYCGEIVSAISDYVDISGAFDVAILDDLSALSKEQVYSLSEQLSKNSYLSKLGDAAGIASLISSGIGTIAEAVELLVLLNNAIGINDSIARNLRRMQLYTKDVDYSDALEMVADCFDNSEENLRNMMQTVVESELIVATKTASYFALKGLTEAVKVAAPWAAAVFTAIQVGRDVGKILCDELFGTSESIKVFYNLKQVVTLEKNINDLVIQNEYDYYNNLIPADDFVSAIDLLFSLHLLAIDCAKDGIEKLYKAGALHFGGVTEMMDVLDVIECSRPLTEKYYKSIHRLWTIAAYYDYPDIPILVDNEEKETKKIVNLFWMYLKPRSGIDMFVDDTLEITKEDIQFTPFDTTEQEYVITSSNDAIISVKGHILKAVAPGKVTIRISSKSNPDIFDEKTLIICNKIDYEKSDVLDIAFVIDTTSSMRDDIYSVQVKMNDYLSYFESQNIKYRIAVIDYRDFSSRTGDSRDYPYRIQLDFTNNHDDIVACINRLSNLGNGGDNEETLNSALIDGLRELSWGKKSGKTAIVMGDAPALNPEPITGYTTKDVVTALNGISVRSGYTPKNMSKKIVGTITDKTVLSTGIYDSLKLKEGTGESDETSSDTAELVKPIIPGEKIFLYAVATSSIAYEDFSTLAKQVEGVAYESFESITAGDVIEEVIHTAPMLAFHEHINTEIDIAFSCSQQMQKIEVCQICSKTSVSEDSETGPHSLDFIPAVPANVDEEGNIEYYKCKECGKLFKDSATEIEIQITDTVLPKLTTHIWDEGKITKGATSEEEGVMTFTCTVCGETKTEPIPRLDNPILNEIKTGTLVTFGSYPQSLVTDSSLLASLNSQSLEWNYYEDDAHGEQENYMEYADITLSGNHYRAVRFSHYRYGVSKDHDNADEFIYQDDNGYNPGQVYWFKYEPLVWRVLDADSGLMMTEKIIDSQPFNNICYTNENEEERHLYSDKEYKHYANNWAYSSLRKWMNEDFYKTAFDVENACIRDASLTTAAIEDSKYDVGSTTDKLFLLTKDDVINEAYGFSHNDTGGPESNRIARGTDYAKCQGLFVTSESAAYDKFASSWFLRNPYPFYDDSDISSVEISGNIWLSGADTSSVGIRPALYVDLKSAISKSLIEITDTLMLNLGDVNGDGQILAGDARLALRYSAKIEELSAAQILAADVDENGQVLADDARQILRYSAKLQHAFDKA